MLSGLLNRLYLATTTENEMIISELNIQWVNRPTSYSRTPVRVGEIEVKPSFPLFPESITVRDTWNGIVTSEYYLAKGQVMFDDWQEYHGTDDAGWAVQILVRIDR